MATKVAAPATPMTASEETIARQAIESALAETRRASVLDRVTVTAKGWLEAAPGTGLLAEPEETKEVDEAAKAADAGASADDKTGANPEDAATEVGRIAARQEAASANPFAQETASAGLDRRM